MAASTANEVSKETLIDNLNQINEIDLRLDASSDNKTAGKRAIANQVASKYSDEASKVTQQVTTYLQKLDTEALVGVYTQISDTLRGSFSKQVEEFLEAKVASQPKATPIAAEEMTKLVEQRKSLADAHKALRIILEMFNTDVSDVSEPKKRTGKSGVRGPRASSLIDWEINGEPFKGKLASVADALGFPGENLRNKAKSIRLWMEENVKDASGNTVDLSNPPSRMEFTAPNGAKVVGTYDAAAVEADSDDDDEETENDS